MTLHIDHHKSFVELKKSLTAFQHSLHMPEDQKKGVDHPGNQVATIFFSQYRRATWYHIFPEVLEASNPGENKFVFKASPRPHGLLFTDLCQKLPTIICHEGFEARWTHNVGSNVIVDGTFNHNDTALQHLDQVSDDMHSQSMIEESARFSHEQNIGNLAILQDWNSTLPTYETSYTIPWFYSRDLSTYFPLYFCGFLDRIEHRLTLRRSVPQLLMVRNAETGERVPCDAKSIMSIDGHDATGEYLKMPMPTMYGEYLYLSDIECSNNRCFTTTGARVGDYRNVLYIEDMIAIDEENPSKLGDTVTLKCENSEFPVHTFAWVAQHEGAKDDAYYSNYSTNPQDHTRGWSPIASTTMNLGKARVFEKYPSFRTERVHTPRHFPCGPREPGYNFWTTSAKAKDYNPKPGVVIKNGSVTVRLQDTNPLVGLRDSEKACRVNFRVKLRMTYTKRVVFTTFPHDESERETSRSVVSVQGSD